MAELIKVIRNYLTRKDLELFMKTFSGDINYVNKKGNTSLHYAVMNNDDDAVEILLIHGANTNIKNKSGNTPLFYAIDNNYLLHSYIIINLLNYGADVEILYNNSSYLLDFLNKYTYNIYKEEFINILETMIDRCSVKFLNIRYPSEYQHLHGSTILEILTDSYFIGNMNLNHIIILMINKGVDINSECEGSNIFFDNICKNGNTEIFDIVIPNINQKFLGIGEDNNIEYQLTLIGPIINGHVDIVERLLERGYNPNRRNIPEIGTSPLMYAAINLGDRSVIIDLLLQYGADINYKDKYGNTALFYANDPNVLNKLVLYGGNINELNNKYRSPLYYAIRRYRYDLVKAILNFGPVIDVHQLISRGPPLIKKRLWYNYPYPKFAQKSENISPEHMKCLFEISWYLIIEYITPYL